MEVTKHFLIILCLFMQTGSSFVKKTHVVSHVETEIGLRLKLVDKNNDLTEELNSPFTDQFREKANAFCSAIDQLFLTEISFKSHSGDYEGCRVNGFNIVKYNGKTEGATVNAALTFVGKYTSDVVPYIFDTMTDQSLREVYNGKLIFGIGGVYFTNFEVTSVIVWINTHEVKSPVLTRRNDFEQRMLQLIHRSNYDMKEEISRSDQDTEFNRRQVYQVIPIQQINERLEQLKRQMETKAKSPNVEQNVERRDNDEELLKSIQNLQKVM